MNRMPDIRLPVAALGYHPTVKTDVGRPRRRWVLKQVLSLVLGVVMMMKYVTASGDFEMDWLYIHKKISGRKLI